MKIVNLDWTGQLEVTRQQVRAMAILSGYAANIESELKEHFEIGVKDVNWERVREIFHEFNRLYVMDQDFVAHLSKFKVTTQQKGEEE